MECAYPASRGPQFNLTGGPTGAAPATLAALGRPILHHLDPAFGELYQQTAGLLQRAFEASQIGHMGPGAYPLSPVIAVTAVGRALRAWREGRRRRRRQGRAGGSRRIARPRSRPAAQQPATPITALAW